MLGVCSSALYCTVGEEILLLHGEFYGEVPFGIALPDVRGFLASAEIPVGAPVSLSETALTFGKVTLPIDAHPYPPHPTFAVQRPNAKRIADVRDYVLSHGSGGGFLSLGEKAQSLAASLARFDPAAAEGLLGRGRGLTPSGDDFLCGFFTLLLAASACTGAAEICRRRVLDRLDRTALISAAYLRHALCGEYFTVYDAAARALLSSEDFRPHCDFLFQMGASSGTDTLLGALCAAETLE